MFVLALVNGKLTAGYFALVLLYLLLASFVPWLMVPVGAVIILAELLQKDSKLASWIGSFHG